jgi:integrase
MSKYLAPQVVQDWSATFTRSGTQAVYVSILEHYWQTHLESKYGSIKTWIAKIIRDQRRRNTRTKWAAELFSYINTYVSDRTKSPLSYSAKLLLITAVKSFIAYTVGKDVAEQWNYKIEPTVEEVDEKATRKAISTDEVRALYNACQNNRDRAIIVCLAGTGLGPREFVQFASTWKHWFRSNIEAPVAVSLVREKKRFPYHVVLWEDAVDALKVLFQERLREVGPTFENLFVNFQTGQPNPSKDERFTQRQLNQLMALLRDRTQMKEGKRYKLQKIRPHAFRHYFRTQARLHHVDQKVAEFCLGHSPKAGDPYGYDRSHLEPQWVDMVQLELRKMTDVLNIVTGRAQRVAETKEADIRAKAAKDTYKTLIEAGVLKPENLSEAVLKIVAQKVGVTFDKLVLVAGEDWNTSMAIFDLIAKAVDLSDDVYHKYLEALRVMKPFTAKSAWENTDFYWMRVEVGSDEYMQALADHFELVDKDDKMRILRKPKPQPN